MPDAPEKRPQASGLPPPPVQTPRLKRPPKPPSDADPDLHKAGLAYSIPSALAAPVIVLTLGGAWLDGRFHWGGVATLSGAILGFAAGLLNAIRLANRLNR
jgi:hypothetical protein